MNQLTLSTFKRWLAVLSLVAVSVSTVIAAKVEIAGVYYNISNDGYERNAVVTYEMSPGGDNYRGRKSITIPDEISYLGYKYRVTQIGYRAFNNALELQSIKIPASVHSIDALAFENCTSLETLSIPGSVTSFGGVGLNPVVLSQDGAIINSDSYIQIKGNISEECSPLSGCSNLRTLIFEDSDKYIYFKENIYYDVQHGILFYSVSKALPHLNNIEILYLGRNIGNAPITVKLLANNKCYDINCNRSPLSVNNYKSIEIGDKVTKLPEGAFYDCERLENFKIGESLRNIPARCLSSCYNLNDISIGQGVDSIAPFAFASCYGLREIRIPGTVKIIGEVNDSTDTSPFYNCTKLARVVLEDSESPLLFGAYKSSFISGKGIFSTCPLEYLYLGRNIDDANHGYFYFSPFSERTTLTEVEIGDMVTTLPQYAFEDCNISDLNLPANVKIIRSGAFDNNKFRELTFLDVDSVEAINKLPLLESLYIGDNVKYFEGITNSSSLEKVRIGNTLTAAPSFSRDSSLIKVSFGHSVESLPRDIFYNCVSLKKVSIPENVSAIGIMGVSNSNRTFESCTSLNTLRFEDGSSPITLGSHIFQNSATTLVTPVFKSCPLSYIYLGRDLRYLSRSDLSNYCFSPFYNNLSIKQVIIGSKVNSLSGKLFLGCSNLSEIISLSTNPPELQDKSIPTQFKQNQGIIYIPKGTIDSYLATNQWSDYVLKEIDVKSLNASINTHLSITALLSPSLLEKLFSIESTDDEVVSYNKNDGKIKLRETGNAELLVRDFDSRIIAVILIHSQLPSTGDSNGNGMITITDAVNTANYAVGHEVADFCFEAADVNGDNRITLADASGTVTEVLNQPAINAAMAVRKMSRSLDTADYDMLNVSDYIIESGKTSAVDVKLNNTIDYVALQADIVAPEGMSIIDVEIGERGEANHSLMQRRIDGQTTRIALFDINNMPFADNDEAVIRIIIKADNTDCGDIVMNNIIASDANAREYVLTSTGGHNANLSGVEAIYVDGSIKIEAAAEGINIYNADGKEVRVYSVDGMLLAKFIANGNIVNRNLSTGVYVVAVDNTTAKVMVK